MAAIKKRIKNKGNMAVWGENLIADSVGIDNCFSFIYDSDNCI